MKKIFLILFACFLSIGFVFAEEKDEEKSLLGDTKLDKVIKALIDPMEKVVSPIMELGTIVVTPTKTKEKLGAQSSAVTVIGETEFYREKADYVKDVLKNEMGLDVVESGAFTGQTSVFMRGANSNQTLVMIDGVKVYDPTSPNGAFNLAHLTLDNLERIEIVRGSQSTLYGSDAMGGVINIITKKAEKAFFNGFFETGAFSTFREGFDMGAKTHGFHYTIGGSFVKSRGISQAQAKNNNPELDGYEQYALSARVDYDVNEDLTVGGTFRNTSTLFHYDQGRRDDADLYQKDFQTLFTQYVEHKPVDFYSYYIKLGWMNTFRRDADGNSGGATDYLRDWYKGYEFRLDYRNNIHLFDVDTFTIGYEFTKEIGDSYYFVAWGPGVAQNSESDMPKVFSRNHALYLQNRLNFRDRLTATQGMRIDCHSLAGTHITYKVDGSYLFPTGTKVRGGWATGFKAPTLYQLNATLVLPQWGWFGFGGGNPNLEPETSNSYEIGLDQYAFGEKLLLHATYFHYMFHSLIGTTMDARFNVSQYRNLGKAHSHGIECGTKFKPLDNFEARFSYTYDYTKDYSTDRPLLRRPQHKFKINTYWEIVPKWNVNLEIRYSGLRYDSNVDKMKPYAVVDFNTDYNLLKNLNVYLKVANLFDKRYEEVRGYGTSPFAVYVGTKAEF